MPAHRRGFIVAAALTFVAVLPGPAPDAGATTAASVTAAAPSVDWALSRQTVSSEGMQGYGEFADGVSADGRCVTLFSNDDRLAPSPAPINPFMYALFLRDNVVGTTERIDDAAPGWAFAGGRTTLTPDCEVVAWRAYQTGGPAAGQQALMVLDRSSDDLEIIPLGAYVDEVLLSPDGTHMAFIGRNGSAPETYGVWVRDLAAGTTLNLTPSAADPMSMGANANFGAGNLAFSADGGWVTFVADRAGLGDPDALLPAPMTNANLPYIASIDGDAIVSVPVPEGTPNGYSYVTGGALSRGGRLLVFASDASNWGTPDLNGTTDVYTFDRLAGTVTLETVTASGVQGNGGDAAISPDGKRLAFSSSYRSFVDGDTSGSRDVFLVDRASGAMVSPTVVPGRGSDASAYQPTWSGDSLHVAFTGTGDVLDPLDANQATDVYLATLPGGSVPSLNYGRASRQVTWRNPAGAARVVVRAARNGYPLTSTAGAPVYDGPGTRATPELDDAGVYGIAAFTYDEQGRLLSRKTTTAVVAVADTHLVLQGPRRAARSGRATLQVKLTTADGPVAGARVTLWRKQGPSWSKVGVITTDHRGRGAWSTTVRARTTYRAQSAATSGREAARSGAVTISPAGASVRHGAQGDEDVAP